MVSANGRDADVAAVELLRVATTGEPLIKLNPPVPKGEPPAEERLKEPAIWPLDDWPAKGYPAGLCPACGGGVFWKPASEPPKGRGWRCLACETPPDLWLHAESMPAGAGQGAEAQAELPLDAELVAAAFHSRAAILEAGSLAREMLGGDIGVSL